MRAAVVLVAVLSNCGCVILPARVAAELRPTEPPDVNHYRISPPAAAAVASTAASR